MLCAKFGGNWPIGSGEEILIRKRIFAISLSFTQWKLAWSSFEDTWIPITHGCFVRSLVEIGPVVLKKISK